MQAPLDLVAREIGVTRRAAADRAAMRTIARLAGRQDRLSRRLARASGRLAGRTYH